MEQNVTNGEMKDSLVVCRSSEGVELRGRLVKLTRFAVAFEIFSPASDLRLAEVLVDFRIIFHEHTIYSGRASVSKMMQVGPAVVCEAALDEVAWLEWQWDPNGNVQQVREKFEEFLQGWQKAYKVSAEYKNIVTDLQHFLADFRLWVEQVEAGMRGQTDQSERQLAENIAACAFPSLDTLFDKYERVASQIEPGLEGPHQVYVRRQLQPLLLCAPFANRAVTKPMGYAGDYGIVNMILDDPHRGDSLYAKILHRWFVKQPPAEAHRNRVKYLTTRLHEESLRVARSQQTKMRAYNVGAGPAREVQDFMAAYEISNTGDFTLVDFSEETLAHGKSVLEASRHRHKRQTQLRLIKKSVAQLLKSEGKIQNRLPEQQYELVYCAGLFDYLTDAVCREFMEVLYGMVAPGGLLIATNVDASNPRRLVMDYILEWPLIYRNAGEMKRFKPNNADWEDVHIASDNSGVNIYLEVRKTSRG